MHGDVTRRIAGHGWWMALLLGAAATIFGGAASVAPVELTPAQRAILDALRAIESGNRDDFADTGRDIGPYQIGPAYWHDATTQDPELLVGSHEDCRNRLYAERVIAAYMRRYCPEAWSSGNAQIISRTHNGGPRGPSRAATLPYWLRVRALLADPGPASSLASSADPGAR